MPGPGDECKVTYAVKSISQSQLWEWAGVPEPGRTGERPQVSVLGKILQGMTAEPHPKG